MTRSAASEPAAPGTELAPGYRVLGLLGRGKRLDVHDGWSDERDSRCVLKTLRPDRASEPGARRALELEGRLLRRLAHPHLVRAYETVTATDGRPVVVLETLGGETVSHLLHRLRRAGTPLDPLDVAMLGRQLCSAAGYLHRHGLLHRDIKPANIVAEAGRAKLIDLSLVRRPGPARAGAGTFQYLAPEQARGGLQTTAVDVWGIGAVLFAALAAGPPFGYGEASTGEDEDEPSGSTTGSGEGPEWPQLEGRAPRLVDMDDVPHPIASLVDQCLEPEPDDRPTIAELGAGLDTWLEAQAAGATR